MLLKEEVKNIILKMEQANPQKINFLEKYIDRINRMTDEEFEKNIKENNLLNQDDVIKFVNEPIEREIKNSSKNKFKSLNETVGFGVSDNTLHIHVMPTELKEALKKDGRKRLGLELIDSLEKIQEILKNDENYNNISHVYAVSTILRGPILDMFKDLEFDTKCLPIKKAKEDKELAKFYEHFKDGKFIGRAEILREKILSKEWIENKERVKTRLKRELGISDKTKEENKNQVPFTDSLKQLINEESVVTLNDEELLKKDKIITKNITNEKSI